MMKKIIHKNRFKLQSKSTAKKHGFSMIEIIIVIGIIAIMIGVGATNFTSQANRNRLNTTSRIIATTIQQARQMAIAMRQDRRVVIDAGELDGFTNDSLSGVRVSPAKIWIEGKRCQQLDFDVPAVCQDSSGELSNAFELTDTETLPDGVMIGLDGGNNNNNSGVPGIGYPSTFYIEFSPRGAVSKVYYQGEERSTLPNAIEPLIYLVRDNESFQLENGSGNYLDIIQRGGLPEFELNRNDDRNQSNREIIREDLERYNINTIEVIRLTGRTRTYDYAVLGPFPIDHPPESVDYLAE